MTSTSLPFPHSELTPIVGKPEAASIKLLTKEVYANTKSVPSTAGGGLNGHLGIAMPPAQYLLRAGEDFILPAHPSPLPVYVAETQSQITAGNRIYDAAIDAHKVYIKVREQVKQQILLAVAPIYLQDLEDETFGYADVTIQQLLDHLRANYGTLNANDLEINRNKLAIQWNPEEPFENFWSRIKNIKAIAVAGGDPILNGPTIELSLQSLRLAGVYDHAITTWEDRPLAEQTWANFQTHFTHHEKTRIKRLTAQAAGYHGANQVLPIVSPPPTPESSFNTTQNKYICNTIELHYCWSHGVSKNPKHTSESCVFGLCSVDKDFPIHLWDQLIPQAEIMLNLMRSSRINPKLSAHAQIQGQYDFNRTPIGPPGCRVVAHVKPDKRGTWSPHGLDGWYVGPSLDSYRCYDVWILDTRAKRICDTVTWFPTQVRIPDSSSNAIIVLALNDILQALKNPSPKSPIAPLTDSHVSAITTMHSILTNIVGNDPVRPASNATPPVNHSSTAPLARTPVLPPNTTIPLNADVSTAHPVKPCTSPDAPNTPSLRVIDPAGGNNISTPIPLTDAASLRVPPTTTAPPSDVPTATPTMTPTVTFAPTSAPTTAPTYAEITSPKGRSRRQRKRKARKTQTPRRSQRLAHSATAQPSTPSNPLYNACNLPYDGRMLDEIYEDNGWGYHVPWFFHGNPRGSHRHLRRPRLPHVSMYAWHRRTS